MNVQYKKLTALLLGLCLMGCSINLFSNNLSYNNQASSVDLEDSLWVYLELFTDNYGEEVSMEITDANGGIIASYSQNELEDNTLYSTEYCLGAGCYNFSIEDQYNDGICCSFGQGYYEFTNSYGQLLGSGGDYGPGHSFEFCLEVIVLENIDATILSVEPEGFFCSSNTTPSFVFRNDGESDITNAIFEYALNGEILGEFEWEGLLSSLETIALDVPTFFDFELGENSLTVNIVSVNGTTDDNVNNDVYISNLEVIGDAGFTVNIETAAGGYYSGQKSYTLFDNEGNVIEEIISLGNSAAFNLSYCLPEDCFSVVVESDSGDGGIEFTVEADAGYTIIESENFSDELITYFCTAPPIDLDGSISEIPFPLNGSSICGTSLAPVISLFNNGLEPITEIIYEYNYDGNAPIQETWTGNLTTFNIVSIPLTETENFTGGEHQINVNIVSVNGQNDEEADNNAVSHTFTIVDEASYTLNFTADLVPQENSYQISNEAGNVFFSGEQGVFGNPFGISKEEFCLPPGCYTITIFDAAGNGGPSVTVTDDNDDIVAEGTLTGAELGLDFCIEGEEVVIDGLNDLPQTAAIELFPNPSTGVFYLKHQLEGDYQITVQDLLGRKVHSQSLIAGQNTLYLDNNFANGVYLLAIENSTERGVFKMTLFR